MKYITTYSIRNPNVLLMAKIEELIDTQNEKNGYLRTEDLKSSFNNKNNKLLFSSQNICQLNFEYDMKAPYDCEFLSLLLEGIDSLESILYNDRIVDSICWERFNKCSPKEVMRELNAPDNYETFVNKTIFIESGMFDREYRVVIQIMS